MHIFCPKYLSEIVRNIDFFPKFNSPKFLIMNVSLSLSKRSEVSVSPMDLQTIHVDGGKVTESGVRVNVSIALQYLNQWLEVSKNMDIF